MLNDYFNSPVSLEVFRNDIMCLGRRTFKFFVRWNNVKDIAPDRQFLTEEIFEKK